MSNKRFVFGDVIRILLALFTLGAVWAADNLAAVVALVSIVLVYAIKWIAQASGKKPGKQSLTIALFIISVILGIVVNLSSFPAFPVWTGDSATYAPLLFAWFTPLGAFIATVMSVATGIYNIFLEKVLAKIPIAYVD